MRLKGYDYTLPGAYFVTILTYKRQMLFGKVVGGEMLLNDIGKIVHQEWLRTVAIRPYISLDAFVIMPNHLHGIIFINEEGATGRSPLQADANPRGPASRSLGAIVAGFKSAATKRISGLRKSSGEKVWHRNYYDHIVRNAGELDNIRDYIEHNPLGWADDEDNPANLST